EDGMAQGGDLAANLRHCEQIDQSGQAGDPAAERADAGQPDSGAPPKRITGQPERQVHRHQTEQGGHRKVDQHRMQRVLADGGIAGNGLAFIGHRCFPWLARPIGRVQQWTTLALAVPSLAGCRGAQSTLDPVGPMAREVALVWWVMCVFSLLVLVVVSGLWLYALYRAPRAVGPEREKRLQQRWLIGGGLLLPTISVVLLLFYGLSAGRGLLPPLPVLGGEQPLRIEVTGHQWWWEVRYPDSNVITANQLILPVGRPVDIQVGSADVIHAFWVPKLGGKLDMMPGRRQVLRLQ